MGNISDFGKDFLFPHAFHAAFGKGSIDVPVDFSGKLLQMCVGRFRSQMPQGNSFVIDFLQILADKQKTAAQGKEAHGQCQNNKEQKNT